MILREVRSGGKVRVEELDLATQQIVNLHSTSILRAPMERNDVDYIPTTRNLYELSRPYVIIESRCDIN